MNYTFNEADLTALGVTDANNKAILLKTTITTLFHPYYPMDEWSDQYLYRKNGIIEANVPNSSYTSGYNICVMSESADYMPYMYIDSSGKIAFSTINADGETDSSSVCGTIMSDGGGSYKSSTTVSSYLHSVVATVKACGKVNIFGIIYDGDKTLTYNGNTVNISVYDETGITVKGYNGVKRIIYNNSKVLSLNLGDTIHDLSNSITLSDGTKITKPVDDYSRYGDIKWIIYKDTTSYNLIFNTKGWGYSTSDNKLMPFYNGHLANGYDCQKYSVPLNSPLNDWELVDDSASSSISISASDIVACSFDLYNYPGWYEEGTLLLSAFTD